MKGAAREKKAGQEGMGDYKQCCFDGALAVRQGVAEKDGGMPRTRPWKGSNTIIYHI